MNHMGVVERPTMEYSFPTADGTISSIGKPIVQANNFEIKPSIIQILWSSVRFFSLLKEDPNKHLSSFLEIRDIFKLKPSIEKPPSLELKPLPSHLKYVFLGNDL
ncbi:hypothetical protein Sango_2312300 [Sesamum angolense]|uniref:Uncharacterized protein n=1 Tax=Sesamum angolense TaxID=2727404 RepID=A0AAE1WAG6_9LAMI|nr:hypothetical protein Sango_2312300 [Sesamum angolense]